MISNCLQGEFVVQRVATRLRMGVDPVEPRESRSARIGAEEGIDLKVIFAQARAQITIHVPGKSPGDQAVNVLSTLRQPSR